MAKCAYCESTDAQLRRRVLANGSIQFTHQCLTCGRARSNPLSRSAVKAPSSVPAWDDGLNERYERSRGAAHAAERAAAKAAWFQEHDAYLRTTGWRVRRFAVMKRAKGICEGCGSAAATQVHHLSYEHWKQEFLWELVAICDDCHERVHAETEVERTV